MRHGGRLRAVLCGGLALTAAIVLLLSVPVFTRQLYLPLQIYPALSDAQITALAASPATAIVVLSAGRRRAAVEYGGATVDPFSLERVRYAARLARLTGLPVLTTGGFSLDHESLAGLLARTLDEDWGITPRWQEGQSRTTAENAIDSAPILRRDGITRIVLVTHAWHMRRAVLAFRAQGFDIVPAPTAFELPAGEGMVDMLLPSFNMFRRSLYALHELIGFVWYEWYYGYR